MLVPENPHQAIKSLHEKFSEIEKFMAKQKLPRLRDTTAEISQDAVQLLAKDVLGVGGYGVVFKGIYEGKEVAVKTMFAETTDGATLIPKHIVSSMRKEALILSSLNHPNILRVRGIVPESAWIIMEYCPRGSLQQLLLNEDMVLSRSDMLSFASGVATGVAYLHLPEVSIVHGDLKAANVLLANDGSVRLCDFGMSQAKNRSKTITVAAVDKNKGHALTIAWTAPELFKDQPKSFASDVYALGVTLWEIFERRTPFGNMPEAAIVNQVLNGERPILRDTPSDVKTLIEMAWPTLSSNRSTAAQLAYTITHMYERDKTAAATATTASQMEA
jgi:serine/threonine protein kinase